MISETFNKTIVFIKGGIQMYKKTIEEVVNSLDTNIEKGLTSSEAKKRQGIYGTNELEKPQKREGTENNGIKLKKTNTVG